MNIKNFFRVFSFAIVIMVAFSFQSDAAITSTSVTIAPADSTKDAEVAANIVKRVNEIDKMDKSSLSPTEKKALRNELKDLKDQAEGLDSKVYLSIGAIIIIILLLILILR